jgi:hypothetical protein
MDVTVQKWCIWFGVIASVVLFIGLWPFMHFLPAPSPALSAAQIAGLYRSNDFGMLAGSSFILAGSALYAPFLAAISTAMEQMEGAGKPLAKSQSLLGMMALCVPISITSMLWMTAAYRPDLPDNIIQLLNDLGWNIFFMPVIAGCVQVFILATAIFRDQSAIPIFPRWFGYFNIWYGILLLPGGALAFFKTGPFALNGIFVFWLGTGAFGVWLVVITPLLLKAANRHAAAAL